MLADHVENRRLRVKDKRIDPFITFQDLVIVVLQDLARYIVDFNSKDYDRSD